MYTITENVLISVYLFLMQLRYYMDFVEGISILSLITTLVAFGFFYFKKIDVITLIFYVVWFLMFLSFYISTTPNITANESLVGTFALLFFVWLLLLPPLLYGVVLQSQTKSVLPISNFYISSVLLIINLFSLFFFSLNDENEKNFTYEVVENVMTYVNYIVILFLFPVITVYYSYLSYKVIYRYNTKPIAKLFYNTIFLYVLSYNLFILFWFLNYIFDIPLLKYCIKCYFFIYFPFSLYTVFRFYSNRSELEDATLFDKINERLLDKITKEKIYLDFDLTLRKTAKEIGTNEKYLSNAINTIHNVSFSNFINNYRVAHAENLLNDSKFEQYTIETIGNMSGFNSKSNFNSVFKKITGKTPKEFKLNK